MLGNACKKLFANMPPKGLDYELLNENVKKVQYAVRGELYLRASELQKEGKKVEIFAFFGFACCVIFPGLHYFIKVKMHHFSNLTLHHFVIG